MDERFMDFINEFDESKVIELIKKIETNKDQEFGELLSYLKSLFI